MTNNTFNTLPWHDSMLKSVNIDRSNPGINDIIIMIIEWNSGLQSKLTFKDVYFANMEWNFGVIAEESILDAETIDDNDEELYRIKEKWKKFHDKSSNICGYQIITASTGSKIRVFAISFLVE